MDVGISTQEADLAAYFGPRGKAYLAYAQGGVRALPISWSWWAFGCWIAWTGYHRLWRYTLLSILLPLALGALFPDLGDLLGVVLVAMFAKEAYRRKAIHEIEAADAQGLQGEARLVHLRRQGKASPLAGLLAAVATIGLGVLWVYLLMPDILSELSQAGLLLP